MYAAGAEVMMVIELHFMTTLDATSEATRVVSSEISGGKFSEIYSNLSGNFLKNFLPMSIS